MDLRDVIERELDIVFRYGANAGRGQLMPTQEQVIAEARERILKTVEARVDEYREPLSNQPGWEWMKARGVLASETQGEDHGARFVEDQVDNWGPSRFEQQYLASETRRNDDE